MQHRHDRRLEVGQRLAGPHDGVADAVVGLGHVHAERRVEAALHQAGEERDAELPVALEPRLASAVRRLQAADRRVLARQRALELLADVDGERRVVVEVEALELVVAEDHDHVGPRFRQLSPQHREAFLDARVLAAIRLQVVDRHVRPQRARAADLVPVFRPAIAERGVRRLENAD